LFIGYYVLDDYTKRQDTTLTAQASEIDDQIIRSQQLRPDGIVEGGGLGFSIAQQAMRSIGGHVQVEPAETGTTISVFSPNPKTDIED